MKTILPSVVSMHTILSDRHKTHAKSELNQILGSSFLIAYLMFTHLDTLIDIIVVICVNK